MCQGSEVRHQVSEKFELRRDLARSQTWFLPQSFTFLFNVNCSRDLVMPDHCPVIPDSGRPGGNRTPNLRFWRPPLCQLSYWPFFRYQGSGIRDQGSVELRALRAPAKPDT